MSSRYEQWVIDQDDCLVAMSSGKKPPRDKLRNLPPWRAVMIARICNQDKLMTDKEVEEMVLEARHVGGIGKLSP